MQLTEEQLRIVSHSGDHARVSAVAGSGKTTTMIARIGHLLQQGVEPKNILVLMFNRSAREGFESSMGTSLGPLGLELPEVRTFHSLGLRLVTSFEKRGALPEFRLVTEDYVAEKVARQVATSAYQSWSQEQGYLSNEEIEAFLGFIDRMKATVEQPWDLFRELDLPSKLGFFPEAYELFEQTRKQLKLRFYSDLIHEPVVAMSGDSELSSWVSNRVDHIIVDEYQDINETQQLLLKIIAGSRAKVMAVGDVDQCIYEWRGAKPEYMTTRFGEDFPNPILYKLSSTFRYGHQLSLAANHLICNNKKRDSKLCISHPSTANTTLEISSENKPHPLPEILNSWMKQGRSLDEATVLVRLFSSTVPLELALLEAHIPYRIEGGADIFESREIEALLGYLKLVLGALPGESRQTRRGYLLSMLSQPHPGIAKEEMEELVLEMEDSLHSVSEIFLRWQQRDFAPFIKKRFRRAAEEWRWLGNYDPERPAADFLRKLVERLELYDFYHSFGVKAAAVENRVKTCEAFIDFSRQNNQSIRELVSRIEELREDRGGSNTKEDTIGLNRNQLLVTSIHRAKGLEWPLVILAGLEEGIFPFYREERAAELEDERRLFYVALTRAKERLVCIHPVDTCYNRSYAENNSKVPRDQGRVSRFLYESNLGLSKGLGMLLENPDKLDSGPPLVTDNAEVSRAYLAEIGAEPNLVRSKQQKKKEKGERKSAGPILTIQDIVEGVVVSHPTFGEGVVVAVHDRKQGRIGVSFSEHGEMILLVPYAKLRNCCTDLSF